jgi:hypothetical protein
MKTSTWLILGGILLVGYLYLSKLGNKISWMVQNIGIGVSGLTTQLNVTFLVTSAYTTTITVSGFLITCIYNGANIGTGILNATISPGQQAIPVTINLSDVAILLDIEQAANNGVSSIVITFQGSGLIDSAPVSFSQNYTYAV